MKREYIVKTVTRLKEGIALKDRLIENQEYALEFEKLHGEDTRETECVLHKLKGARLANILKLEEYEEELNNA